MHEKAVFMVINPVFLVFVAILFILLAFAIPSWLFLRQEAMRADIATAMHEVKLMTNDYTTMLAESATLNNKINEVSGQLKAAEIRSISTEETLRSLGNKINSRERVEKKREMELAREEDDNEIPGTEQLTIPFDNQQPAVQSQPPKLRRFGERV